jgi:WD40 repeat protein
LHDEETKTSQRLKPTRDKVHRITYLSLDGDTHRIACSAGREVFVTEVKKKSFQRNFSMIAKFSDWIMNLQYLSDGSIAIVTGHNIALLLEESGGQLVIKRKLICDDNSTLYCSHIDITHGNQWTNLTFLSGTALGELIIWKGDNDEKATTVYQKSLHNGVIFSIDYKHGYIVTGSDDRSIKVFKANESLTKLHEQRQLFGHTSRIFVGRIIKHRNSIKFLSAGEDSNLCIWNEDGTLKTKKNIASGGIWNMDYDESRATIITSSATGKLNRFQLDKIFFEEHRTEIISTCKKIDPTKLVYLQNGTLCVLDSNMHIYTKSLAHESEWMHVDTLEHKIVAIDACENRLFLVAKNSILTFDCSNNSDKLSFSSDLNILEKFSLPNGTEFYFRSIHVLNRNEIFISDMHGHCFVIDVERECLMNLFKIPKCSEPWMTAVAKYSDDFWVVGDRVGSLLLYKNNKDLSTFHLPIHKISKLHGLFGVTTIRLLDNGFFKTTGIGGAVKTLYLNEKTESIEIYQTEKTPVISVQAMRIYNGVEYLLGFNDNYFVMSKNNEIIYEHRCGGGHRQWDISLVNRDDCKMRFTYINKKQIHSVEFAANDFVFNDAASNVLWHLKGCNVIRMIDDAMILISAGEDTFLKITQVQVMENDVSFRSIADVNSHISSIKALATFTRGNDPDLFIISVGGRAQIVLTRVIKMRYVKEEINFMLTGFYNRSRVAEDDSKETFDLETRFTCVHFDENTNILIVGCSDGFIRAFKLVEHGNTTSLKLIIESFYGRCILQLTAIKNIVLSMATDGVVCFWSLDESRCEMRVIEKLLHNQNGINCYDVFTCGEGVYRIATAGDDSGIYVTEFELLDECIKFYKTINSYRVHTAQVTGIKFLSHDEILSAGIDQMVCKLKIRNDKFDIVDKKFTCISDVKGFAVLDKRFIFVHGAGLEKLDYF